MFIGVGRVIHGCGDFQELRDRGGLWFKMPFTRGCLILARISLIGVPFLSGFYSKDLVVESFVGGYFNWLVVICFMLAIIGTVVYVIRFFVCTVWGKVSRSSMQGVERNRVFEFVPVVVLGLGAVGGRFLMQGYLFYVGEVFVLEGIFKRCLGLVLMLGVVVGLVYSVIGFVVEAFYRKMLGRFFARI